MAGMDKPRVAWAACGRARSAAGRAREARARCLGGARGWRAGDGCVGVARARACRPWWSWHGHARQVLDRLPAGRAPANAGRGRGLEQGARVGEYLGSKGQLQDEVGCCFAAGLGQVGMGVACHAMAA